MIQQIKRNFWSLGHSAIENRQAPLNRPVMAALQHRFPQGLMDGRQLLTQTLQFSPDFPSGYHHPKSAHFNCVFRVTARVSRMPTTRSNS